MSALRAQWRAFAVLARARVAETFRSRAAAGFLFGFPAVLLVALAMVFAEGHPYERRAVALACDRPEISQALAREPEALSVLRASEREGRRLLEDSRAELLVTCPRERAPALLEYGPRARLTARAVIPLLPADTLARTVPIARGAYARGLLPGAVAFGALFAGLYGLGLPMLRFRRRRVLARLSLTPLSPLVFVLAQLSARVALTVGQSLAMLAVGAALFRLSPSLTVVLALSTAVALGVLAFAGIGLALASLVPQEDTHGDLLASSATPLVLLSGAFFPVSELPSWLATIARALPSTALVEACRAALDPQWATLAPPSIALLAWALAALSVGVRAFDARR